MISFRTSPESVKKDYVEQLDDLVAKEILPPYTLVAFTYGGLVIAFRADKALICDPVPPTHTQPSGPGFECSLEAGRSVERGR